MDDEKLIKESGKIVDEIKKILFKKIKNKDKKYCFNFMMTCIPILLCEISNGAIDDRRPDIKISLINDFCELAKVHLVNINKVKEVNSTTIN